MSARMLISRANQQFLRRATMQAAPRTAVRALSVLRTPAAMPKASAVATPFGTRGVKHITFSKEHGPETVYERADWPLEKLHDYFKNDTFALIGYGSQGHGQGLNLRDNGMNVIVGVRKNGASWKRPSRMAGFPARPSSMLMRLLTAVPSS